LFGRGPLYENHQKNKADDDKLSQNTKNNFPGCRLLRDKKRLGGSRHRDDFTNNRSQNFGIEQPSQLSQIVAGWVQQ